MIFTVAKGLKELNDKVAFCGGGAIDFYIDDPAAPETRVSDDVDCVIEIATRLEYHKLEARLAQLKFEHPPVSEQSPICRWKFSGIKVDIMPTEENVLGFKNKWYSEGLINAKSIELPDRPPVRIFSLPYFVAAKLDAFEDRGNGDYLSSRDIEDIVALVDGCKDIVGDIKSSPPVVREYIREKFERLLNSESFIDSLEGHVIDRNRVISVRTKLEDITQKS